MADPDAVPDHLIGWLNTAVLYDRPARDLLSDAAAQVPHPSQLPDFLGWFGQNCPAVDPSSVTTLVIAFTANDRNRRHHPTFRRQPAVLFRRDDGSYEPYEPERHGRFNEFGEQVDDNQEVAPEIEPPAAAVVAAANEDAVEYVLEAYLEQYLYDNWRRVDWGRPLDLYQGADGLEAHQFPTPAGRIDFLARDTSSNALVVIELKRGRTSEQVVGQVTRYLGWVREHLAQPGQSVEGVIVAQEAETRLKQAAASVPGLSVKTYDLTFGLADVALAAAPPQAPVAPRPDPALAWAPPPAPIGARPDPALASAPPPVPPAPSPVPPAPPVPSTPPVPSAPSPVPPAPAPSAPISSVPVVPPPMPSAFQAEPAASVPISPMPGAETGPGTAPKAAEPDPAADLSVEDERIDDERIPDERIVDEPIDDARIGDAATSPPGEAASEAPAADAPEPTPEPIPEPEPEPEPMPAPEPEASRPEPEPDPVRPPLPTPPPVPAAPSPIEPSVDSGASPVPPAPAPAAEPAPLWSSEPSPAAPPQPEPVAASTAVPPAPAAPPPPVQPQPISPAGWFPDPAQRHEYRFWDGFVWTPHVSDRGAQSFDPI